MTLQDTKGFRRSPVGERLDACCGYFACSPVRQPTVPPPRSLSKRRMRVAPLKHELPHPPVSVADFERHAAVARQVESSRQPRWNVPRQFSACGNTRTPKTPTPDRATRTSGPRCLGPVHSPDKRSMRKRFGLSLYH